MYDKKKIISFIVLIFFLSSSLFNSKIGLADGEEFEQSSSLEPYIYVDFITPENSFGVVNPTIKHLNESFYRDWLNKTVVWHCEKSLDNISWVDADKCLEVVKEWNSKTHTEKHTLIVTADEDAYYRVFYQTPYDKNLNIVSDSSELLENSQPRVDMCFEITDTENYNIYYDWSDYEQSSEFSKSYYSKQVISDVSKKKSFEYNIYTSSKLKLGEKFIIDPVFGEEDIGGSSVYIIDSTIERVHATAFTAPENGRVDNISLYILLADRDGFVVNGAVYEYVDHDTFYMGEQYGITSNYNLLADESTSWITLDFPDGEEPVVVGGTTYYLTCGTPNDAGASGYDLDISYNSASGESVYKNGQLTSGDNPMAGEAGGYTALISIYASYTAGTKPEVTLNSPDDTGIVSPVTLNVTVADSDGDSMDIVWYGDGEYLGTNSSVNNGTYTRSWSPNGSGYHSWNVTMVDSVFENDSSVAWFTLDYWNDTFSDDSNETSVNNVTWYDGYYEYSSLVMSSHLAYHDSLENNASADQVVSRDGNWSHNASDDWGWLYADGDTPSGVTGCGYTTTDGYSEGDYSLYIESSSSNFDQNNFLETDNITLTSNDNLTLSFRYHMYGQSIEHLTVEIVNMDGTSEELWNVSGQQHTNYANSDPFHEGVCGLEDGASYPYNGVYKIRINGRSGQAPTGYYGDICIDALYLNHSIGGISDIDGFYISDVITRGEDYWDEFFAYTNNSNNCSFALIDATDDNYNISSGLSGDGDDISSITNETLRVFANFSGTEDIIFYGYNVTWSSQGAPTNNIPASSGESPTNNSVDLSYSATGKYLYNIVTDTDSDTMNITWSSNSSGSWVQFGSNSSVSTGTNISQLNSNFSEYATKYWWRVNISDGEEGYDNETYCFTIESEPPINITSPNPTNASTIYDTYPYLKVDLNHSSGSTMDITWYSNSSGSWQIFGKGGMNYPTDYFYNFDSESDLTNWTTTGSLYLNYLQLTGDAKYASHNLSLEGYTQIAVTWTTRPYNIETDEYLYLRFFDGTSWTTIRTVEGWQTGIENTDNFFNDILTTDGYTFNNDCKICWNTSGGDAIDYYRLNDINLTYGYKDSMTNGTYGMFNLNFSDRMERYYWNVSVTDSEDTQDSDIYNFIIGDVTPPTLAQLYVGNKGQTGGPHNAIIYTPDYTGYYINDSYQNETWISFNISSYDSTANVTITSILLNWLNETTWTNDTYYFVHDDGTYYTFNSSGNFTVGPGYNYSFNIIVTNSEGLTTEKRWEKYGPDYSTLERKYVQLGHATESVNYTPLYLYEAESYALSKTDTLHHDQGAEGGSTDTGYLLYDTPTDTNHTRDCTNYWGYFFDENICVEDTYINNIWIHTWWNSSDGNITIGTGTTDSYLDGEYDQFFYAYRNESVSNLTIGGTWYSLDARLINLSTPVAINDNVIYQFFLQFSAYVGNGATINNRSYLSWVEFNIPDNTTLQGLDSDEDGINDYDEHFTYFTNSWLDDTDNDGTDDADEISSNSDPNDYTDTGVADFIWIDVTNNSWDIGNVEMSTSSYTNATGKTFICDMDNTTVNTDLKIQITNDASTWNSATSGNTPDTNIYRLNSSIDLWVAQFQIITASATTISSNIVAGNNETFDLRFDAPTATSTGILQTITNTATLVKH